MSKCFSHPRELREENQKYLTYLLANFHSRIVGEIIDNGIIETVPTVEFMAPI